MGPALPFNDGDGHAAGSRAITFDEQYRLPAPEVQLPVGNGYRHALAKYRCLEMCDGVAVDSVVFVVPVG